MDDQRFACFTFLTALETELNRVLPSPAEMKTNISAVVERAVTDSIAHERFPENAFLYRYVVPAAFQCLTSVCDLSHHQARDSLRCEYHAKVPELSIGNAFRKRGHPFGKIRSVDAKRVFETWEKRGAVQVNQAFPDLAIGLPAPFRLVVDAKYFTGATAGAAAVALVEGLYEAAFYRGLPAIDTDGPQPWGYDFGCLVAYDTSVEGHLFNAWRSVQANPIFWEGANVTAIVLRGEGRCPT